MSISLMSLVWQIPFPTSTQMLVALKLADHANDDGSDIFPGRASLAARARCSESSVKMILKLFRESGILIVVKEGGKGPHDTTVYRMNVGLLHAIVAGDVAIDGCSTELSLSCGNAVDNKGAEIDHLAYEGVNPLPVRGQPIARKGSTHCPQTITNHHESPSACARATQSAALPLKKAIVVRRGDPSWTPWIAEIATRAGNGDATKAEAAGVIECESRWPAPGSSIPRWPER